MEKTKLLKRVFGFERFQTGQQEVIDAVLGGRDAVAVMPTGSGKSLCFQLPAVMMSGMTIVISPLISLMKDQFRALKENGIPAAFINSTLSAEQTSMVINSAKAGRIKILYIAPERLDSDYFLRFAKSADISVVAVDEAHCVSQWGQNFRPSYLKISAFIDGLRTRPVVAAFTATATKKVLGDIISLLGQDEPLVVSTGFDRENLFFEVRKPKDKFSELEKILGENQGSCIVYCSTRNAVEEVCFRLNAAGFSATRYHAGLDAEERKTNQEDFLFDRRRIMAATNAFGMGIDKSNVSMVVHYNMPKDIESYYQEAGRAGRDASPAQCILFYSGRDVSTIAYLISKSADREELSAMERSSLLEREHARLNQMKLYCSTTGCLRDYILEYFGDEAKGYCGNCGSCLANYEEVDITVEAQKIISCIFKTRQRYGVSTIIDVLRGSRAKKILKLGLDENSTYGIMKERSAERIRRIIDFMLLSGQLIMMDSKFPVLLLGTGARSVIEGESALVMKLPKVNEPEEDLKGKRRKKSRRADVDEALFELLRQERRRIAGVSGVPAFVVFSDSTLADMCAKQPGSIEEFLGVSGVGEYKADKYAEFFIPIIKEYS